MSTNAYESPFSSRYASEEMQYVFSQDNKFKTWRKLWIALAKAEKALGINITDEQIAELDAYKDNINYEIAREREKLVRHDVMSHVYAYGCECPNAKGIIHLGATSCYVGDNTDVIIMREGLEIVRRKLLNVIAMLAKFAQQYKDMPCLAYTHLQPAQLTTVGKRATLWINELLMDEQDHGYALTGDALSQAAIAAANRSHMPYSKSPSGVALECKDGRIFSGSYAENAAFNPTLPPLQGALILLNLKGYDYPDIQRAVLAEKADAPLIQWDATSATLKALGCLSIDRVLLA